MVCEDAHLSGLGRDIDLDTEHRLSDARIVPIDRARTYTSCDLYTDW